MTRLRKFRTLEDKINLGLKIFCCLLILTIIVMGKSLAEYKQEAEVTFIRARVGKFKENDIQLAIKLDGEQVDTPPEKNDLYTVTVDCDNATGVWDKNLWGATITEINANKVKCEVNFGTPAPTLSEVTATSEKTSIALSYTTSGIGTSTICKYGTTEGNYENEVTEVQNTNCNITGLEMDTTYYYQVCAVNGGGEDCKEGNIKTKPNYRLSDYVKIGDYISMTPTSTAYAISKELTNYSSVQFIDPSELNLWRVISKNEDGTIDMVSEYVSSQKVYFNGKTGYMNFVGALNTIAAQYTNSKYVQSTRHMRYSNQTEKCTSLEECSNDTGALKDTELVKGATGALETKEPGGTDVTYWLASREYQLQNRGYESYGGRGCPGSYSTIGLFPLYESNLYSDGLKDCKQSNSIRPILTLKSTVKIISGDGKSAETAYRFE